MAKRRYCIDERKIAKYARQGRGKGEGKSYKPWLTIQDVPSKGRSHRVLGWKTRRVHHLLSDIEYRVFLLLNWSADVCDIREQFPLDRRLTVPIAEQLNVRHPQLPGMSTPMVMTTDFLIVAGEGARRKLMAIAVKSEADLDNWRVLDKLDIERLYWEQRGVPLRISLDTGLPMRLIKNLDSIHSAWDLSGMSAPNRDCFKLIRRNVLNHFPAPGDVRPIATYCAAIDEELQAEAGTSFLMVKHLVARRHLSVDLTHHELRIIPASGFAVAEVGPLLARTGTRLLDTSNPSMRLVGKGA